MPKGNHQVNLHAFFGAAAKGTATTTTTTTTTTTKKAGDEDDPPASSGKKKLSDSDENEDNNSAEVAAAAATAAAAAGDTTTTKEASSNTTGSSNHEQKQQDKKKRSETLQSTNSKQQQQDSKNKKRRVIEDDDSSDDDDDDEEEKEKEGTKKPAAAVSSASSTSKTAPAPKKQGDEDGEDDETMMDTEPAAAKKEEPEPKKASKPAAPLKGKSSATAKATKKSNGGSLRTDEELAEELEATWDRSVDPDLPYSVLCQALSKIEAITARLQIQDILTTLLRQVILLQVTPDDLCHVLYLASNSVAPAYECVELGIGDAILIKALAETTGASPATIKQKYETEGDLGTVAQTCKSKQRTLGGFFASANKGANQKKKKSLSAKQVLTVFREIAKTKGNQSQKWKVDKIKGLLVHAESAETRYIIRGLQGKLRIGLAESTVIISLAHALAATVPKTVVVTENSSADDDDSDIPEEAKQYMNPSTSPEKRLEAAVAILKKAYSESSSYNALWQAAQEVPLQDMHKVCTLTPGIPVTPMLAKPTKSIQEVLQRLNGLKFTCEYKYDGERAQVHLLPDGKTKVFSRNLLDTSEKYPEVPQFVKEACKNVESFVLDAEVVAFNSKTGQFVPFQILSTRKKTEVSAESAKVQVIVQAFDLMYLNGKSLLQNTLEERRRLMHEHFVPVEGKFQFAKSIDHEENGDTEVIEDFLDAAVKNQCEGLMVKTLDVNAIYEPSRRSLNWLKLKKDYLEGLGDSLDLVPLGAYHGRGKRTGVYGAYLLACYDADTEEFQSVCKIGTGFSDEDLKSLAQTMKGHILPQKSNQYNVSDQLECDVWFDAVQVWEVKAADLSQSSAHRGAVGKSGEEGRGIGLRFPRFERVRDDKRPDEATTSDQILDMYYAQDSIVGGASNGDDGI